MAQKGYQLLSDGLVRMVEAASTSFTGGKRGREDEEEFEEGIGNYHRKRHEWLYCTMWCLGREDGDRDSRPRRSAWRRGKEVVPGRGLELSLSERKSVKTKLTYQWFNRSVR